MVLDRRASALFGAFGVLSRPHVLRPLGQGDAGTFELLARYDDFDFKDAPKGGEGHAVMIAATWYPADIFDLKLNYIR